LATCRRLARETRSDTAVEFALIGTAFFLFVFGIFVVSIDQFLQLTLDDAVRSAARQVQIGSAKTSAIFVSDVCAEFGPEAPNCANALQYDVQLGSSFSAMSPATLASGGTLTYNNATNYPAALVGSSCTTTSAPEFLLVQVAYKLPFKILLVPGGVATGNGTPALLSTVAVDMEPCVS
jgi:Flp pilus assembly protein TadG